MLKMSDHFSREAKLMPFFPALLVVIGVLAAVLGPWINQQVEIDRCLDAGGRYDHGTNSCIRNESLSSE